MKKVTQLFLTALLCSAVCGGIYALNNYENEKSVSNYYSDDSPYELVKKYIDEIKNAGKWSEDLKGKYLELRNETIPLLDNKIEKENALNLLDKVYCEILVKDAQGILDSGCTRNGDHTLLKKLIKEINTLNKTATLNEENITDVESVCALYKTHQDVASFLWVANQKNVTYKTPYDTDYESNKKNKVDSFLENKDIKCTRHRRNLERMKNDTTYFVERRMSYCRDVVRDYLQCMIPEQNDYYDALSNVEIEYISRDSILIWDSIIEVHYNELQPLPVMDTLTTTDTIMDNEPLQMDTIVNSK